MLSIAVSAAQQAPPPGGGRGAAPGGRGAAFGSPSADALQVTKLTDNLYVFGGGGGNTAVFVTANGVMLVDTKVSGWGQPMIDKAEDDHRQAGHDDRQHPRALRPCQR